MPYNPNIPQAAQRINDTQSLIQTNFTLLNTYFGNNHVAFDAGADEGKHTLVKFFSQGTFPADDPAAVPATTEKWLYNLIFNGNPELFIRTSTDAAGTFASVPMTAKQFVSGGVHPVNDDYGWTYLPSGLVIKFGTNTSNPGKEGNVSLNATPRYDGLHYISAPFALVAAYSTPGPNPTFASVTTGTTASNLICHTSAPSLLFNWITIGVIA